MRKFSAIVLLFAFLLYHLGYYGFYLLVSFRLDQEWHTKIYEDNISGEDLLHTAIPLSIPYQPDQSDYTPISAMMEIDGNYYRIVRQKYAKDTLHVVYVNDTLQKVLKQSVDDWLASILQKPSSDGQPLDLWKVLTKDFILEKPWQLQETDWLTIGLPYKHYASEPYSFVASVPTPPPQV